MPSLQRRGKNTWRLVVSAGKDSRGKYIRRTKTVHCNTKREALLKLNEFSLDVLGKAHIKPEKMRLQDFCEEWRDKYAIEHLGVQTLSIYLRIISKRILPVLGHLRLDEITPIHLLSYLSELRKEGSRQDQKSGTLASGTIYYNYRVLKNILNRAVEWRIIDDNPLNAVKRPREERREINVYDEEQTTNLLRALEYEPFHWKMMINLALVTGMRRGELVGLEWSNVNLIEGVINIKQSISFSIASEAHITKPKTKNSIRKITVPEVTLNQLRAYKDYCVDKRKRIGDRWAVGESFFVFFNDVGKPFYPESPYLWFRGFLQRNSLPYIRFHDLRHTSATLLINKGVHTKIISNRLGHASVSTTLNVYGHALLSADREASRSFNDILSKI